MGLTLECNARSQALSTGWRLRTISHKCSSPAIGAGHSSGGEGDSWDCAVSYVHSVKRVSGASRQGHVPHRVRGTDAGDKGFR